MQLKLIILLIRYSDPIARNANPNKSLIILSMFISSFSSCLKKELSLPVVTYDERLTSIEAKKLMNFTKKQFDCIFEKFR